MAYCAMVAISSLLCQVSFGQLRLPRPRPGRTMKPRRRMQQGCHAPGRPPDEDRCNNAFGASPSETRSHHQTPERHDNNTNAVETPYASATRFIEFGTKRHQHRLKISINSACYASQGWCLIYETNRKQNKTKQSVCDQHGLSVKLVTTILRAHR